MYCQDDEEKKFQDDEDLTPKADEEKSENDGEAEQSDEQADDLSDSEQPKETTDDETPSGGSGYDNGYHSYSYNQTPPPKKSGKSNSSMTVIAVLLACIVLFVAVMVIGISRMAEPSSTTDNTSVAATNEISSAVGDQSETTSTEITSGSETSTAATNGSPSVVRINDIAISPESTVTSDTTTEITNLLAKCYAACVQIELYSNSTYLGCGSGVIYTTDGYILTNYHVAGPASINGYTLRVILTDGSEYEAVYVCGDLEEDVAVLKIDKNDCTAAVIGNSDASVIGETVYAIGNPNGVGITITSGVLSSKNKSGAVQSQNVTVPMSGMFLFSAPINGGNSGGGLFNAKGELIGLVNSKGYYDKSGNALEGMSQAIPIATVIKCVNTLAETGGYIPGRAKLGVVVSSQSIRFTTYHTYVTKVNENSAAADAGIQVGDIIAALDGHNLQATAASYGLISDYDALHYLLLNYSVGDSATITVLRPTTTSYMGYTTTTYDEITLDITFTDFNYNEY